MRNKKLKKSNPKRWTSLQTILTIVTMIMGLPTTIGALNEWTQNISTFPKLKETQQWVQKIEEKMGHFTAPSRAPISDGEREYSDPTSGEHSMTDTWSEGRLKFRSFFAGGRLIARDSFQYDKNMVVGKVRVYIDSNNQLFLEDRFTQDGLLTKKIRHPKGQEYLDDMRSPLPPPQLIFYR
jgi:hypothetical protein